MTLFEVFSHSIRRKYKTSVCSKATVFYVIASLLTFIPPLLITYRSQGFWKKINFYREQPDVHFKHKMLLLLETKDPEQLIFWSSFPNLNQLMSKRMRIPTIENREEDVDRDGRNDRLHMNINVPVADEEVLSVKLILIFDYKLHLYSSFQMESLAFIQYSSPFAGSSLSVVGELSLQQRHPLQHRGKDTRYNSPIINESENDIEVYTLEKIFSVYSSRNVTTVIRNAYPVWRAGRGRNQPFTIKLDIVYPEETVLYRVGFWELIKWAWVQYFCVLAIFLYIFRHIKQYVFQRQLVLTTLYCPLQQKV